MLKTTVAICTYNGEKYIEEQLKSIVNQTVLPNEIVICDDHSTDRTVEIAERILIFSNIPYRIIVNKSNRGVRDNFQQCFDLSNGDLIFSCDQDDVWEKNKIERFIEEYSKEKFVLAFSDAQLIDQNGKKLADSLSEILGFNEETLTLEYYKQREFGDVSGNFIVTGCTMVVTNELYKKVKPFAKHWIHDTWIAICAPYYGKIKYIPEKLIKYRQHSKNTSGSIINTADINKGKNKYLDLLKKIKALDSENWFSLPSLYANSYSEFFDRYKSKLEKNEKKHLEACISFYTTLVSMKKVGKIKAIGLLKKQYKNGNYSKFRGNKNTYYIDILYLILHKK